VNENLWRNQVIRGNGKTGGDAYCYNGKNMTEGGGGVGRGGKGCSRVGGGGVWTDELGGGREGGGWTGGGGGGG